MTHSNGVLDLSTSGGNRNGYSIISPNTYTSDIFEARIYFAGASDGKIADWPAFWLSSLNWPDGGEMDLAEGLSGTLQVESEPGAGTAISASLPAEAAQAPEAARALQASPAPERASS